MEEVIEMGKISARGQIAIPAEIRREMDLQEGQRVLFVLENDTLMIKKITSQTFSQITKPLKEAMKKTNLQEKDVPELLQQFRKSKKK
ncbi:TPA: AbrB/MazE/SpoVT family DNA-binding domain-containing protein [Candidatus Woesearchaeota archaeon]|nr:AbrB/MazE/SpoVT family DNA-binding domain-containing protein [Candidatus Woesearchaeota archaeon]